MEQQGDMAIRNAIQDPMGYFESMRSDSNIYHGKVYIGDKVYHCELPPHARQLAENGYGRSYEVDSNIYWHKEVTQTLVVADDRSVNIVIIETDAHDAKGTYAPKISRVELSYDQMLTIISTFLHHREMMKKMEEQYTEKSESDDSDD